MCLRRPLAFILTGILLPAVHATAADRQDDPSARIARIERTLQPPGLPIERIE